MSRIEKEKQVITQMISLYCRRKHHSDSLCKDCEALKKYAFKRLDSCPYGDDKGFCNRCTTHCYAKKQREQIKEVMRFSGPRMIFYNPKLVFRHLFLGKIRK
jgi:uncharacterized paraquat-inducible protein A